ncbi:MAG: hypothetical protein WBE92_01680 [Steroidobacteraceae bacterium]
MVRPLRDACGWAILVASATLVATDAAAAQPADQSAPQDAPPLQEVRVTASKLDRHTLKRVAIQFVRLHGAVSPVIHQIGRWQADVCPRVTGLNPRAEAFVSRRVKAVARSVGAPTPGVGKRCAVNVEIVFTPEPQPLLNHIAKAYPGLLGSARSAGDTIFRHAIQSWYLTGTKAEVAWQRSRVQDQIEMGQEAADGPPRPDGARVDPAYGGEHAPAAFAGSHFTTGLTSELLLVFVVVDTRQVAGDSLRSIADYIAMLALTRMGSLDGCSELPSIIDLLSSGCDEREKPQALTEADTAYLKALYSSDLEMNLNIELGDMRDRMVTSIAGR